MPLCWELLGDEGCCCPLAPDNFPGIGRQLSIDNPQQGGFSGTVTTEQTDPVGRFYLQVGIVEQAGAAEGERDLLKREDIHKNQWGQNLILSPGFPSESVHR